MQFLNQVFQKKKMNKVQNFSKKLLIILIIITNLLLIPGCWNYREINELAIVTGAAIDKSENGYIVTVETVSPKGGDEFQLETDVVSAYGKTIFDGVRNLILIAGQKMYWSHAKVIVVSKEVAEAGILPVLDFITRDAETRSDVWLLISRGKTAKEIFEGQEITHDAVAFHLDDMLKAEENISKFHAIELWYFLNDLSSEGISPTVPTTRTLIKTNEFAPEIYGTAVFKRDKMIGWLDGIETKCFMIITDKVKGGFIIVENVFNSDITLEVFNSKTKITPKLINDQIVMYIDVKMDVTLAELAGEADLISRDGRGKVKHLAQQLIKKDLQNQIKTVQQNYRSDIFGFGKIVKREMPDTWKKVKNNWEDIFSNLETKISVEINIRGSSLTSKPIKVSD